jgi:hypothetical protein
MMAVKLIAAIIAILIGVFLLLKVIKKHNRIDTESIAVVKSVQDLGRSDGRKVYAITYDVKSSEPFELLITPCSKQLKIGKERGIFYEKANPKSNKYFKSIGQFDNRFILPIFMLLIGILAAVAFVLEFVLV